MLCTSLLNWMLFGAMTGMFQQPLAWSTRNGGRCIAAYLSPGGTYVAEVKEASGSARGWNVAYMDVLHMTYID